MASNDEYQQIQFWKPKLLCEEIKNRSVYPITPSFCVEKDDKGNCLMSSQYVMIDFSKPGLYENRISKD